MQSHATTASKLFADAEKVNAGAGVSVSQSRGVKWIRPGCFCCATDAWPLPLDDGDGRPPFFGGEGLLLLLRSFSVMFCSTILAT